MGRGDRVACHAMAQADITALAEALRAPFPVVYLDFRSVDRFLYRIRDLDQLSDNVPQKLISRLDHCHLYMICKRPRLSVVPNSVTWDDQSIWLKVSCAVKGVTYEGAIRINRPAELHEAMSFIASGFPHRELLAIGHDGRVIQEMLFANLAHFIDPLPSFTKQLEVLYIGKGLSKNAQDRLASHQTLQRVLAEINAEDPESEVFALVFRFDYRRSAGGIVTNETEAMSVLKSKTTRYEPTLDEQVSLVEAAAISYFRTDKFNSHYIDFPATDTEAARSARKAGAAYIVVQIDTDGIGGVQFFSQRIEPQATHYIVHRIA
jgi:hypothetical protein